MSELPRQRTAGLIVIGNEVLSAKTRDQNTPTMLDHLMQAGVRVREVAVLPDEVPRIAQVVRDFAARFDVVLTTGGVGPTHDDCTWQAVGLAFEKPLVLHEEFAARMEQRMGVALTPEQKRMAMLPVGTEFQLLDGRVPTFHLENVYVLPGVPSMAAPRIEALCALWSAPRPHLATVYFGVDEWSAVPEIDALVAAYPDLDIGSYPVFHEADHRLRLTLEGGNGERVAEAVAFVTQRIGAAHLVRTVWRDPPA